MCSVLFDGTRVHCANLGDSRALKVKIFACTEKDIQRINMVCKPLSIDHKCELENEANRIKEMGGVVDTFYDEEGDHEPIGPQRVWVKGESYPGLAMSRSLGDAVAHTVGVSSIPEVKSYLVGVDDKFIVIGSDGVWEFLTNENIAEIVFPFYKLNQPETAANEIVR